MTLKEFFEKEFEKIGVELSYEDKDVTIKAPGFEERVNSEAAFIGLKAGLIKDIKERVLAEIVDGYSFFCENPDIDEKDEGADEIKEMIKAQANAFKNVFLENKVALIV